MYLPLFADEHDIEDIPVFYGAISIYLKQMFPVLKKAPAWFDRILNSKPMLKLAASQAGSTRAKGLEEMTISMLEGEKGQQHDELEHMTDWIRDHFKPDVVHISNALLLGLSKRLKEKLRVPIICTLQDEDTWVDVMSQPSRERVWKLMFENADYVDHFISVSRYFTKVIHNKMKLPENKMSSIHIGVDPADYQPVNSGKKPRTIGFISRMCYENGLDILVDAFIKIKKQSGYEDVKLILTGGYTADDKSFLKKVRKQLRQNNLTSSVDFHKNFEDEGRQQFFAKTSLISVPVRNGEAFGIYMAEAMASGIPVVQPALGAFPEIVGQTGGGIVYEDNTPEKLAASLKALLDDPESLSKLSDQAEKGVREHLDIHQLAKELIEVYQQVSSPPSIIS